MPNTSSSVPFLLSSSMQSIRSRRPSAALGGSQGGSSGLLQQLGSGMVRVPSTPPHHRGGRAAAGLPAPTGPVRKCPSLNITFSWAAAPLVGIVALNLVDAVALCRPLAVAGNHLFVSVSTLCVSFARPCSHGCGQLNMFWLDVVLVQFCKPELVRFLKPLGCVRDSKRRVRGFYVSLFFCLSFFFGVR